MQGGITPNQNDVLSGRGGKGGIMYDHAGNQTFRKLVKMKQVCLEISFFVHNLNKLTLFRTLMPSAFATKKRDL